MKTSFIVPLLFLGAAALAQSSVSGYVYEDTNGNQLKDRKEKGIAGVSVSNGQHVSVTDQSGRYSLPLTGDNTIFVIKPSGYQTLVGKDQLPKFYYHFKPEGSPTNYKYAGVAPTGKLSKSVDFPLYKTEEEKEFTVLVFGDPQPYNLKEVDYFRRGIINEVKEAKKNARFGITLGDLVGDDLSLHQPYIDAVKELQLPWYNVMGNHDMNYEAIEDSKSDETFEKNFGTPNYAFNYANAHFVILDNILYPDPRDGKGYWGGLREEQLQFFENDLKNVDPNTLIVVSYHIQMQAEREGDDHFRLSDRERIFNALKPFKNVLLMSAHTHKQTQIYYGKEEGWSGEGKLHEINMGTTSGDWYSGTVDSKGVPMSIMRDGTYRGYSYLTIKDNKYEVQYKVAGHPESFLIKLHVPKVVTQTRSSAKFYANFFTGSASDKVEYRIDGSEWKPMNYTKDIDPSFMLSTFKWDERAELEEGRRPSNPEPSNHLWSIGVPKGLSIGTHSFEVRATDRYGKTSTEKESFQVEALKFIP